MVVPNPRDDASVVGILSFEAAATMSRLVSLHRSLSDAEVSRLRSDAMRSQGVAYLNSTDQSFLLRLACAELVEALDAAAEDVSRLSRRCRGALPVGFDRLYTDLKSGSIDPSRLASSRSIEKKVKKMAKYVAATERLFHEMELLNAMEATERRKWSRFSGPIPVQKLPQKPEAAPQLDIKSQLQKVRRLKEDSLWSQSFDKAVEVMALAAYSIFARICVVFGPYVSGLPHIVVYKETSRMGFATPHLKFRILPQSGPLERAAAAKEVAIRNSCPIPRRAGCEYNGRLDWSRMLQPPPHTVGGSGLALRYANVILQAEKVMLEGEAAKEEREELYWQLPLGLRAAVRAKLRDCWRKRGPSDGDLAMGWKDAVWRIMGWLGPVAHDTVRWQGERTMDRAQRFESQPRTLALQTLQFSDREKTEAAIAEVLVGLSLVCWYEEQGRGSLRYC
ncbi:uncharacterized protein M6B38_209400 [Iris pallida]|uniref:Uncharacterized protein n=1 Tax=Iris pallida TaxID=29817 RepID=A0AAX6E587_IRIPA|nr:uncharacterized protein M6B38_209400 [Iris pallida]